MAKQRITPGGTIDAITQEEIAEIFQTPQRTNILCMGGGTIEEAKEDIPYRGYRSMVTSHNRGDGSDNFTVPAAAIVELCDANVGRIAGTIINIGSNPVYVYMAKSSRVTPQGQPGGGITGGGIMCGYLFGNGGKWDFRISDQVWHGPVSVYSLLGSTLVWGVH